MRQLDVREPVVERVARPDAAVPALRLRLWIPRPVAPRQVDRRAHGLAVQPHAPPRLPPRRLEHLEDMPRTGFDVRGELDVLRSRARDRDLVVDLARPVRREGAVTDLNPLGRAVRAGVDPA